ncbi:MAG: chemotaxis protein CheC [Thermodesulfobacteriota bacterium]
MIELSDMELDAISEAFNIGIGHAASSLSEMLGQEVSLSVPEAKILQRSEVVANLNSTGEQRINGVSQRFSGPFLGRALLLFPEEESLELVRVLLKQDVDLEFLSEMEQDALVEVGNIILNACLSSIAHIVDEEMINEIPDLVRGDLKKIITGESPKEDEDYVLLLRMDFAVKEIDIGGYIAFLMDIQALDTFRHKLLTYFGFSEQ